MNSIDVEVIRTAIDWLNRGRKVVLCTVVRTWGSAPRPPGSLMIIRDDGQVAGSVSGGCIEDDLVSQVAAGRLVLQGPDTVSYGRDADEARRMGLPCGGTVQLVLEPLQAQSRLAELLDGIENHTLVQRTLDLATGRVRLDPASPEDALSFDGRRLVTVHGPRHRMLIIGGGQLSRCIASLAVMLDYRVTVCEPREEYREGWHAMEGVTLSSQMPDDLVLAMRLDCNCAVVAVTHDPKLDDLALMEALRTPAFYVGALGSRRNNEVRRERLLQFGVSRAEAQRMHGPLGLNIGGLTPAEIALSVMAEVTALRRGTTDLGPLGDWSGSTRTCVLAEAA